MSDGLNDRIIYGFKEQLIEGNEQFFMDHCKWLLSLSPERREAHYSCSRDLVSLYLYPYMREQIGLPFSCSCYVCFLLRDRVKESIDTYTATPKREANRKPTRTTNIYLMHNKRNGYIKIGYSKCPLSRESTLQSEEPDIELLFSFPSTKNTERELHQRYAEFRIRGEWFNPSRVQVDEIRNQYIADDFFVGAWSVL